MIQLTCPWCDSAVEISDATIPDSLGCDACGVVVDIDPADGRSRELARAA